MEEARGFTNAVFLLGCYLVLKLKMDPSAINDIFADIPSSLLEGFRDATHSRGDFCLSLLDCCQGLSRAMQFGWFNIPEKRDSKKWGAIYPEEFQHYENPLNGNLTIVVPGKFVAFQGPEDLPIGQVYRDSPSKGRDFSPEYFLDIFEALGVTDVVRLNEPRYNADTFNSNGVSVHELEFEDCTSPPADVVSRFFQAADSASGLTAVHCKAGLGRTGTLIALYTIRNFGFTAREVMGWLRFMRPGSVIDEQQHYLCEVERLMRGMIKRRQTSPEGSRGGGEAALRVARQAPKKWASMSNLGQAFSRSATKLPPLATPRAARAAEEERDISSARESAAAVTQAMMGKPRLAAADLSPQVPPLPRRCVADASEVTGGLARRALQAIGMHRRAAA